MALALLAITFPNLDVLGSLLAMSSPNHVILPLYTVFITVPAEQHSLEPYPLTMTDSEPTAESVEPSVTESAAEEDGSSVVQQTKEKMSDPEKQGQQQELPPETSLVEGSPGGKHPTHIERCSSLDDIKLTKQKVRYSSCVLILVHYICIVHYR